MEKMNLGDAADAVSSMQALRAVLTEELEDIENRIVELEQSALAASEVGIDEMRVYCVARAALHSGLLGINEVLGWVHLMAETNAEGDVAEVVKSLPTVPVFSIH